MKIKYEFVTETVEIEVTDEWAEILKECDRTNYNNNHAETRRHTTLDNGHDDAEWLASEGCNPSALVEIYAKSAHIQAAVSMLTEDQKALIEAVFIKGMKKKDYAAKKGVSAAAISQQINTIRKKLKKLL